MNTALWTAQALLALCFVFTGSKELFRTPQTRAAALPGVSPGLARFIGGSELLGALGLILPALSGLLPWLTALAALGLSLVMLLAALYNFRRGNQARVIANLVLGGLAVFVLLGRWNGAP